LSKTTDLSGATGIQAVEQSMPLQGAAMQTRLLPDLVIKNAAALYGVQAGRKLIPLASIPYLARVLGPEGWGEVAFVTAMAELIVILIEFGFNLSATRSIARYRDDPFQRGKITMGVLTAQALLALIGVTTAIVASRFIPLLREHAALLVAGLVYAVAQGFVPLWYFQGMERIRLAAAIEISAKTVALAALFVFVKSPGDAWRALAIQALSPAVAVLIGLRLACAGMSCRPQWNLVTAVLKEGWHMFVFRSSESIYGVANAFLLGLYSPAIIVGYFGASEKVSKATAGLVNPIRESLYPRISNLIHRDRREARRLASVGAALMMGFGLLLSICLFVFAGTIIAILMGGRFEPAVVVLKILSPLPLLLATTFSCGQLWLLPLRKDRTVLRVGFLAAAVNLTCSFTLGPRWGHVGMAITVLVSEAVVALCLLWNVVRLRDAARLREV
jgi:PST family polysaccharide transporter